MGIIQNDGVVCTCGQRIQTASISVQVENAIRAHIARYYQGTLVCSDCNEKTRSMSVYGRRCVSKERCRGEMKLDVSRLDQRDLRPDLEPFVLANSTPIRSFTTS